MKRLVFTFAAVMNLLLVDQAVKAAAIARLKNAPPVTVLDGLFNLAYVENRGCAWGMFQGHVWPLAVFGLAALAILVWKRRSIFGDLGADRCASAWLGAFAEPLLYAGIVGNVVDRVFRGYVVDMLDFHWHTSHFPCFNLADTYISVAVGLMLLASFFESSRKKE